MVGSIGEMAGYPLHPDAPGTLVALPATHGQKLKFTNEANLNFADVSIIHMMFHWPNSILKNVHSGPPGAEAPFPFRAV